MTAPKIALRLRAALTHAGVTQAELARRTGRNPSTVSHWIKGSRIPPSTTAAAIAAAIGIRAAWLLLGDGPMSDDTPTTGPARATPTRPKRAPKAKAA